MNSIRQYLNNKMGKAQSKRSVDITTEPKKGDEEVTGKLEKIEDGDRKQLNGDASSPPDNDAEKKQSAEETENDKDASTEKSVESGGCGDTIAMSQEDQTNGSESPKEESAPKNITAAVEEISPLADESAKKTKKEKVKKKWSFRSISFGKKDKQKPAKNEEPLTATPTDSSIIASTNGEAEKAEASDVSGEGSTETKLVANGNASDNELNGQNTPTSSNDEKTTLNATENLEKGINEIPANTTDLASTTTTTTTNNQTDKTATVPAVTDLVVSVSDTVNEAVANVSESITEDNVAPILSNGDADTSKTIKNGDMHETNDMTSSENGDDTSIAQVKSIPNENKADEVVHQNGTNLDEPEEGQNNKSQVEVNTNTTNITSQQSLSQISLSQSQQTPQPPLSSIGDLLSSDSISSNIFLRSNMIVSIEDEENVTNLSDVTTIQSPAEVIQQEQKNLNDVIDTLEPPPLPNSQPPSQVTVFAFNNTIGTDEIPISQTTIIMEADVSNEAIIDLQDKTNNEVSIDDNSEIENIEKHDTDNEIVILKNDISETEVNAVIDSITNMTSECLTTANSISTAITENIPNTDLDAFTEKKFVEYETVLKKGSFYVKEGEEKILYEENTENLIDPVESVAEMDLFSEIDEKNIEIKPSIEIGEQNDNVIDTIHNQVSEIDLNFENSSAVKTESLLENSEDEIVQKDQPITKYQDSSEFSLPANEKVVENNNKDKQPAIKTNGELSKLADLIEGENICNLLDFVEKKQTAELDPEETKFDCLSSTTPSNAIRCELVEKSIQSTDKVEHDFDTKCETEDKTELSEDIALLNRNIDASVTDSNSKNLSNNIDTDIVEEEINITGLSAEEVCTFAENQSTTAINDLLQ